MDPSADLTSGLMLADGDGLCLDTGAITVTDPNADPVCVFDSSALTSLSGGGMEIVDGDNENRVIHLQIQQAGNVEQPLSGKFSFPSVFILYTCCTCGICHYRYIGDNPSSAREASTQFII